ncbi:hypothetical protein Rfer_1046 [Rhodoferax ferrireducens T118]|uniref:HigA2-like helix-turn-helix domain-containing protein n=2 Tax=Rhodoferax ferrireducens TaxID=192843 RepID=Q21ZL6_ALBFT|nr:hypothetical protein Rfer_1046 [Rhodoferax ferrireducens T118]
MRTTTIEVGSSNVYADLGYPDAAQMQRKSSLVAEITRKIEVLKLPQDVAAELLDIDKTSFSEIVRGQFRDVSEVKLLDLVTKLNQSDALRGIKQRELDPEPELSAFADSAKSAADRAGYAIDDALAFIAASNERIAGMESAAEAGSDEPVDLNLEIERERLSSAALRGFFNVVAKWHVTDEDARELLGGIPSNAFDELKRNPCRLLDVDQIRRISFLIGIYKALHSIYGDKLADEWVSLSNKNAIFASRTPMQYILAGGLVGMQAVRNLLDARRDGL